MSDRKARFLMCPVVWELDCGLTVAVFFEREKAEAVVRNVPHPPAGGWRLFPMTEHQIMAWLREQRAQGVSRLLLNPELNHHNPTTMGGYIVELPPLLDRSKMLKLLQHLADIHEAKVRNG